MRLLNLSSPTRQKLHHLQKHKSEFPSKLRPIIDEAFSDSDLLHQNPERILSFFLYNVDEFFLARRKDGVVDLSDSLNSKVDTEQEVETLLRLFPDEIVNETTLRAGNNFFYRHPLYMLSLEPQAHAFLPLFVRVMMDLQDDQQGAQFQGANVLRCRSSVRNLLTDSRNDFQDKSSDATVVLRSLLQLPWFGNEKFVNSEIMFDMMHSILKTGEGNVAFSISRVRFLVQWRPSLLKECSLKAHRRTLVGLLAYHAKNLWKGFDKEVLWEIFGLLVELGLEYYPKELGFVFHESQMVARECIYHNACGVWGSNRVASLVSDAIVKTLQQRRPKQQPTLLEMVQEAATNDEISLDGLYTLLRMDPNAFTTAQRNSTYFPFEP